MPTRRQIREATIQFLYCSDLEGGASPILLRDAFWQSITETDRRNLLVATFKTVHHLALGREAKLTEFVQRAQSATPYLTAVPAAEGMLLELNRLLALESSWSIAFSKLDRIPKDRDDNDVADDFEAALAIFFKIDRDLEFNRAQFLKSAEDLPSLKARTEALAASVRRLQRISERIRMVEEPEKFPEQPDLTKIRQSKSELTALRERSDSLVDAVLAAKEEIDMRLLDLVENYAPSRIDPVDRAILRLGTYELLQTDTPAKVIINEAIELAKRFGTTDSGRFVNGLLDSVAKNKA